MKTPMVCKGYKQQLRAGVELTSLCNAPVGSVRSTVRKMGHFLDGQRFVV